MVGDLKQSIYRFRLAPRLFLEKFKSYRHAADIRKATLVRGGASTFP